MADLNRRRFLALLGVLPALPSVPTKTEPPVRRFLVLHPDDWRCMPGDACIVSVGRYGVIHGGKRDINVVWLPSPYQKPGTMRELHGPVYRGLV